MKDDNELLPKSEKEVSKVKSERKNKLPYRYMKYKYNVQGLTKELAHKPQILQFVLYLQRLLIHRKKRCEKLKLELKYAKKKNKISLVDASTQTDEILNIEPVSSSWKNSANETESIVSIADQVKEAAENALQQTGMVFEETSGMYYDYNTGYYYNPETGLYYHGSTGCYYYYDKELNTFSFHSQADVNDFPKVNDDESVRRIKEKKKEKKKKRKSEEPINDDPNEEKNSDDLPGKRTKCDHHPNESNKNNDKQSSDDKNKNDLDDPLTDLSIDKMSDEKCPKDDCDEENGGQKLDGDRVEKNKDDDIQLSSEEEGLLPTTSEDESDSSSSDESISTRYPPCMRIIVNETSVDNIKIGSLFIVTKEGGTLGREGNHSIVIADENISRHHLTFKYDDDKKSYFIKDIGSRNGTLLNGKIISPSKEESDFLQVVHGSIIQMGSTKLLCHIHKGNDTCGHCEPGLLIKDTKETQKCYKPQNIKTLHRQELRRLKQKYIVKPVKSEGAKAPLLPDGYEDKAQLRREKVGSTHHSVKTEQTSLEANIATTNKGYKMLEKMGWSAGEGLGKSTLGIKEPVAIVGNTGTSGLGSGGLTAPSCSGAVSSSWKQGLWRTTQKRFDKATTSSFFNPGESDEEETVEETKQTQ